MRLLYYTSIWLFVSNVNMSLHSRGQTAVSQGVHAPDVAAGIMSALLNHRRKEESEGGAEEETDSVPSWLTSWWTWLNK